MLTGSSDPCLSLNWTVCGFELAMRLCCYSHVSSHGTDAWHVQREKDHLITLDRFSMNVTGMLATNHQIAELLIIPFISCIGHMISTFQMRMRTDLRSTCPCQIHVLGSCKQMAQTTYNHFLLIANISCSDTEIVLLPGDLYHDFMFFNSSMSQKPSL